MGTPQLDSLDVVRDYQSDEFAVRYRGWFINDEDLLTGFELTDKKREVDYPFYHTVVSDSLMKKAVEAALRMKINLMIPASLMNIDNPDERSIADICARRGMYLTQHHIEPLGVSGFTWEYYWKKRTGEVPLQSYVINPDKCREVWEYYAKLWAEYPNVIWQLGLRGKGDTPVWELDPNVPFDSRGRGRLISNAIADEYRIIEKVLGRSDFVSTVTLWLECGRLMAEKQLELPENSIIVYSDEGANQMFYQDLEQSGAYTKKGIYYHAAFIAAGPHLVRGNNPVRMTEQVYHALGM